MSAKPMLLNLNVQSLNSKHGCLRDFLINLANNHVQIDILAMQEVWKLPYPEMVDIPGFQRIVFKNRSRGNGGGVGFYIKNGINFKIVNPPFETFVDKIFESLTVEICYCINNVVKKILVSNIYRSPTVLNGMTMATQNDAFMEKFNQLIDYLSATNCDTYILTDSNINLLDLYGSELVNDYFNTIIEKGFFPANMKASRMHIDHILTNCFSPKIESGSIIEEISDHFITFLQLNLAKSKCKANKVTKRQFSTENLNNFKNDLQNLTWQELLNCNDVDTCYDLFWTDFKSLYDLRFPLRTVRFNRNCHKINSFMTRGLLTSRKRKEFLHKKALNEPNAQNIQAYKNFRNLYNRLIRTSKKLTLGDEIKKNSKNPKKTWDLLRDVTTGNVKQEQISKIMVDNELVVDPERISDEFNKFFSNVGVAISHTVEPTRKNPENYLKYRVNTELSFGVFSQADFINIVNSFQPKDSKDYYGISNKLIKFIKFEIATPLAHIFNLSFVTGKFPTKLKISRTVPIF
jgi:hypothetical protein